MKLSAWHKQNGNAVEWYDPIKALTEGEYDRVYMSKVFTFTPDYDNQIYSKQIIKGGTGYYYPDGGSMRLIDADLLKENLTGVEIMQYLENGSTSDTYDGSTVMDIINEQPTTAHDAETGELINAMAKVILRTDFGNCALCDNYAKNITIDGINNGCDGNCKHDKKYTEEDMIKWFQEQLRWQKMKGAVKDE